MGRPKLYFTVRHKVPANDIEEDILTNFKAGSNHLFSVSTIAERTTSSRRRVQRIIRQLVRDGFVKIHS